MQIAKMKQLVFEMFSIKYSVQVNDWYRYMYLLYILMYRPNFKDLILR